MKIWLYSCCRYYGGGIDVANEIFLNTGNINFKSIRHHDRIKKRQAISFGEYSSEPLGDYFAGPNHVLPTTERLKIFTIV
ncbi:MAG: histidinol dehydrogenase [Eubacterium sp.]